jgi:hypothetical protein
VLSEVLEVVFMVEKDIVDILKEAGYGVVEGAEEVRKKIDELAEKKCPDIYLV